MMRFIAILTVLLAAGLILTGCEEPTVKEVIRPVRFLKLEDQTGFGGNKYPGRAEASTELNLGFEVSGTIEKRPVDKGDMVKQGELLAVLDLRDFKNEIAFAVAEADRNRAYRSRVAEALKSNAVAVQDLDDADARLAQSRAAVRIKRKAFEDAHIYAPFDGTVSWTYKEAGQRVQAKENVLRLLDVSTMEFTIDIPEQIIANVDRVKDVEIIFDAFPNRPIPARIKEIGTEASAGTRTFPVTLAFEQPEDITVQTGMAGVATGDPSDIPGRGITADEFLLPVDAFFSPDGKKTMVWVLDEESMTVKGHEVQRGRLTARGQFARGLKAGMQVATHGAQTLREGQKVTIATPIRRSEGLDRESPT
ncbi:MAG: efflux RND transporter periplasmic adaptor subunit [Desulfobacterales bacterium]|nr:efflux RND transporter periplasmic adaptor subunit [Desulfobacterales bacterium]MDJ0991548.1 efflux RND transporter periplasmic adaptor subunit [Desulfobacterales bacterium]